MVLSIVIPTYSVNQELLEMAEFCAGVYREHCDELIITEDSGHYSKELHDLADIYCLGKKNIGFTRNVNRGWGLSNGDYTAIASSDTWWIEGKIKDLCIPGKVTSPEVVNQHIVRLAGPFFVVPKEVKDERGMLLPELHTYSSDSEYDNRVADIFQKVPSVKIYHKMAQSVTVAGVEGEAQQEKDREVYARLIKEGKAVAPR